MKIKAKYPIVGNEYVGIQGFGSLYGGNHTSSVSNGDTTHEIATTSTNTFPN
jgi:hypothetical protein